MVHRLVSILEELIPQVLEETTPLANLFSHPRGIVILKLFYEK
jgi:hypothetical protein